MIRFDYSKVGSFLAEGSLESAERRARKAHSALVEGTGAGSAFLGWRDLLLRPDDELLGDIESTARQIREKADVFLVIGIGGSYLGAKAVVEALGPYFPSSDPGPELLFAGHHLSGTYLSQLLEYLEGKSVYVNVISKSGTTLEPAIAFRLVRRWMESRFDDTPDRITVTTDPSLGALNAIRHQTPYRKYVIPPSVGGRFSVLTPVGLLPVAVAGVDIRALFQGAVDACTQYAEYDDNPAVEYAVIRHLLLESGYATEILASFEPCLSAMGDWWQQLFGESEGKAGSGLLPVAVRYSTDLHSLGQYVQDGQRNLLETFLVTERDSAQLAIPSDPENVDGLEYLDGQTLASVNQMAYKGTARAHLEGGVPVMSLSMPEISPESIGQLIYFFEHAVAVGGYLLGVNPFDQPGVEAYKREMFSLLGRP
jgi:glucose-6-phosphate isomerase